MPPSSRFAFGSYISDAPPKPPPPRRQQHVEAVHDDLDIVALTRVARVKARDERVQAKCCKALTGLAEGEGVCQRAVDAGAFAALARGLLRPGAL